MSVVLNKFCEDLSSKIGMVIKYEFANKGLYHEEEGYAIFCDGIQTRLYITKDSIDALSLHSGDVLSEILDMANKYLIEDGFLNREN